VLIRKPRAKLVRMHDEDLLASDPRPIAGMVSRITLSDGLVIAAFDGLPSSASRLP
jgi:hypothetical protein